MLPRFYVYHHINPSNKEVFYVGKGTGRRAFEDGSRNFEWTSYVSGLRTTGLLYSVHIAKCELSWKDAEEFETQEIERLSNEGHPLKNICKLSKCKELDTDYADQTLAIKDTLASLRKAAGIKQSDMAFALGLAVATYAQHETTSRGMTIETACKCLNLLGYKLAVVPVDSI